jgi:hypothetical protein
VSQDAPQEGGSYLRNEDGTLTRVLPEPLPEPLPVDIAYAISKNTQPE